MLPSEWYDFLNRGGIFALGVAFFWAVQTGRLILPREVEFVKKTYDERIAELVRRLETAELELGKQHDLLHKVVDTYVRQDDWRRPRQGRGYDQEQDDAAR